MSLQRSEYQGDFPVPMMKFLALFLTLTLLAGLTACKG